MSADSEDVLDRAVAWMDEGRVVAMATVIKTWGSAPRPTGSQLAVNDHMDFVGSVSGGCVEAATVRAALEVIKGSPPCRLSFGVARDEALEIGLPCGGEIDLLVEPAARNRSLFDELRDARLRKRSVVEATSLTNGSHTVAYPFEEEPLLAETGGRPAGFDTFLRAAAREAAARDQSTLVSHPGGDWFLHVRHPPRRLLIVGAVHVAQSLVAMASLAGFDVTVIDPRSAFATRERFPNGGTSLCQDWPEEALRKLDPDRRTAIVTLTHDTKLDDPALAFAARSRAFYVGALGSRRSQAARLERLRERGLSERDLARIHGPVGLDIGARGTAEIATSILAEMIRELRGGSAR